MPDLKLPDGQLKPRVPQIEEVLGVLAKQNPDGTWIIEISLKNGDTVTVEYSDANKAELESLGLQVMVVALPSGNSHKP